MPISSSSGVRSRAAFPPMRSSPRRSNPASARRRRALLRSARLAQVQVRSVAEPVTAHGRRSGWELASGAAVTTRVRHRPMVGAIARPAKAFDPTDRARARSPLPSRRRTNGPALVDNAHPASTTVPNVPRVTVPGRIGHGRVPSPLPNHRRVNGRARLDTGHRVSMTGPSGQLVKAVVRIGRVGMPSLSVMLPPAIAMARVDSGRRARKIGANVRHGTARASTVRAVTPSPQAVHASRVSTIAAIVLPARRVGPRVLPVVPVARHAQTIAEDDPAEAARVPVGPEGNADACDCRTMARTPARRAQG